MTQRILSVLCTAVIATLAGAAGAQEEKVIANFAGVGMRAMGMGGAFVGVADDFTAAFWNPAGLAQITRREVHVAFFRSGIHSEATQNGNPASSDLTNTQFGSLGVVYPYPVYRGSLVFAGGFNRVQNFDSIIRIRGFDATSELEIDNTFAHEGQLVATTIAAAIDVAPSVSLGLAVNLLTGEDENTQEFVFDDVDDLFFERRLTARQTFSDDYKRTFSATLGAMVRSPRDDPRIRVGVTLTTGPTHEIDYTFKGIPEATGYNLVEYDDGSVFQDVVIEDDGTLTETCVEEVEGTYKVDLPMQFAIGVAFEPIAGLLLAASTHVGEWSQTEYSGADYDDLRANASFETQFDDEVRYHLGAEYQIPSVALDVRAGFYTDPVSFIGPRDPDRAPHPIDNPIIDNKRDRWFLTLGLGMLLEEVVQLDALWSYGTFERIEGQLVEEDTLSRLGLGLSYRF